MQDSRMAGSSTAQVKVMVGGEEVEVPEALVEDVSGLVQFDSSC